MIPLNNAGSIDLARAIRMLRARLMTTLEPISPGVIALDLGSDHVRGAVSRPAFSCVTLPSRLAVRVDTDTVVALGEKAQRMAERHPAGFRIEAPIQSGVITEPDLVECLIRQMIRSSHGRPTWTRSDFVVAAPAHATSVQLHSLDVAARAAGARHVTLVHESIAAALGAGLPVMSAGGSLIVEMGAEKTEVAVLSLGGVVVSATALVGGRHISEAIANHLRRTHHLLIGRASADAIKLAIGSAVCPRDPTWVFARGRDLLRNVPAKIEIKSDALVEPIQDVLSQVVSAIHSVLERTPPELSSDLVSTGIHLSGGASQLSGLAAFLEERVRLPVVLVDEPTVSVIRGCYLCARDRQLLREVSRIG